jgi:glutathione synthase/RimK-type ligase-like ATP-grasp enzyme
MKVLLLFSNSTIRKGRAFPDDLQALLQKAADEKGEKLEFFVSYARSLSYLISNERVKIRDHRNRRNLEDYDFVYLRKAGGAMQQMQTVAYYLHDRGVPFWDQELLRANSRNKLTQMIMLERKGLPIAPTLFCRNRTRLLRLVTKTYADIFSFPIILKATGGSRGDANYLIHSQEELIEKVKTEAHRSFIVQKFIPNEGDYRFFVAGGVLKGIIGRKPVEGSHLSNTSMGAQAEILPVDQFGRVVAAQATQAAQIFGRSVAGVDIMFDKNTGDHYFLEVNRAPQVEHASFETEKADWIVEQIAHAIASYQPTSQDAVEAGVIGRFEHVVIETESEKLPRIVAKVDTGADSSSLHAENIEEKDGILSFTVGGQALSTDAFFIKKVRSTTGHQDTRYYITLPISIGKKTYQLKTTLSNRASMTNEMLIGRRFLREHRLIVDVSRRFILSAANSKKQEV